MTNIPPPPPRLRRQWTGDKFLYLIKERNLDIGKGILRNLVFAKHPKTLAEIISAADARAAERGFTHPTGRAHRSTIAVHHGVIMERREYFDPWHIEWVPILPPLEID